MILIALCFIERHALMTEDQLRDARESLRALFLRTSGAESALRRLIETLKVNRSINAAFSNISNILNGVAQSIKTLRAKHLEQKRRFTREKVTADAYADFVGPFLSFSQLFLNKLQLLYQYMNDYLSLKETEAQCANMFRIAETVRNRLRDRLSGHLGSPAGEAETQIREEIMQNFDYSEAETNYEFAKRNAKVKQQDIEQLLDELKDMCWYAMNPALRGERHTSPVAEEPAYDDIFERLLHALQHHPQIADQKDNLLELFKLYQHSYGIFGMDYQNLNKAIAPIIENTDAYFKAKEEDTDIQTNREKLFKLEGLIPFLEHSAIMLSEHEDKAYDRFSKAISEAITMKTGPWKPVSEHLLRAKIDAEAELSTRLNY